MKPSWKIARIAGIDIKLHATFPLLLVWIAFYQYSRQGRWEDVAGGLAFTLVLFAIIVLHELGHALTAKHFGIRTREITLLPIGGVAWMERMPGKAAQELLVALAGPAVNVALALGFFLIIYVFQGPAAMLAAPFARDDILAQLAWANVSLAGFNLLPAFPMDGGRVLRALLAMRLDYLRATSIAAAIGRGFAMVLAFVGLVANPMLVLIAIFVWIGAGEEAGATRMKSALAGVRVSQVMLTEFQSCTPDESLAGPINHLLAASQQDFPVIDAEGRLTGLLRRGDLVAGLTRHGVDARVGEVMQREFPTAKASETVEQLLTRWTDDNQGAVPVLKDGQLVGLFTLGNLGEYVVVHLALDESRRKKKPAAPEVADIAHRVRAAEGQFLRDI